MGRTYQMGQMQFSWKDWCACRRGCAGCDLLFLLPCENTVRCSCALGAWPSPATSAACILTLGFPDSLSGKNKSLLFVIICFVVSCYNIPNRWTGTYLTSFPPKALNPINITLGLRLQSMNFGKTWSFGL